MELNNTNPDKIDGSDLKITIILPYFNDKIGLELYENAKNELLNNKVKENNIDLIRVAGALEIPFACRKVIEKEKPDAIIALGAIIKGDTDHYNFVCNYTYKGIMDTQLKTGTPIIFGILTCESREQAEHRASASGLNKGSQLAIAALLQSKL